MSDDIRLQFMKGQHTIHHNADLFNVKWSDMAIETTFTRYSHGQSGITRLTLKPETVKACAYNIMRYLNEIRDIEPAKAQTHRKEEMTP